MVRLTGFFTKASSWQSPVNLFLSLLLFLTIPVTILAQDQIFNADSVYEDIEYLTIKIGPRPMGSANERAALEWTVSQFRRLGADSAYIMKIERAKTIRGWINTNSGVAVGIFHGTTDSTIVLGSHIDSINRDVPGANDNASGTASIIELARLWSQRPHRYTLVFAAFGGEEVGLVGSKYFVEHYLQIDQVALMIQLDMTGSDDHIIPLFETRSHQAPDWLIRDALAIDRALGNNRLLYPTHFAAINNTSELAGSDHIPFVNKDIPAICFTNGENHSPIHTLQDRIDFISKPMLGLTGQFVDSLITKYQTDGIPGAKNHPYILWQLHGHFFYMPLWIAYPIIGLAVVLGIYAFIFTRRRRLPLKKSPRARITGLKLLLLLLIIAIFAQLGEAILQFLMGLRYPWTLQVHKYLWLAGLWALAGVWVALQFSRFWRFSPDTYVYSKRVLIILLIFIIAATIGSRHLAIYPALTMICAGLAFLIPIRLLKIIFCLLAPVPLGLLMFHEAFIFFARTMTHAGILLTTFWKASLYSALLVLIPVLWYLPVFYLLSYAVARIPIMKALAKLFRQPVLGSILLLPICALSGYLFAAPSYDSMWRPILQVNARYQADKKESKLELKGNEYFRDLQVQTDSLHLKYDDRIHQIELPVSFTADWLEILGSTQVDTGKRDTVTLDWQMISRKPWYRVELKIETDTLTIADVISSLAHDHKKNRLKFTWYADPPQTLQVSGRFTVHPGARIIRKVTAIYPDMPMPIKVSSELTSIRLRTSVEYQDTLKFDPVIAKGKLGL